jgi:hypothetical protein
MNQKKIRAGNYAKFLFIFMVFGTGVGFGAVAQQAYFYAVPMGASAVSREIFSLKVHQYLLLHKI